MFTSCSWNVIVSDLHGEGLGLTLSMTEHTTRTRDDSELSHAQREHVMASSYRRPTVTSCTAAGNGDRHSATEIQHNTSHLLHGTTKYPSHEDDVEADSTTGNNTEIFIVIFMPADRFLLKDESQF